MNTAEHRKILVDEINILKSNEHYQKFVEIQNTLATGGRIDQLIGMKIKQVQRIDADEENVPQVVPEQVQTQTEAPAEPVITTEQKVAEVAQATPEELGQDLEVPDLPDLELDD